MVFPITTDVERSAFGETKCLWRNKVPVAKQSAFGETKCLWRNKVPVAKQSAFGETQCLWRNAVPVAKPLVIPYRGDDATSSKTKIF
jgi:hypothetical protein